MKPGIQDLTARLLGYVWDDDLSGLHGMRRIVVFVLRAMHMLLRELMGGQLNLRAMSLVYTTLLSIVPLLAVSFSVLKGFGIHNKFEPLLFNFLEPLGPKAAQITDQVITFVDNVKVGVLGSIGFALLIYTVIALVQKIEAAFNFVWQIDHLRSLAQRFSNYLSVILIGPVLIFTAVGFTATVLETSVAQKLAAIEPFGTLMLFVGELVPYLLVCLAFTFIYIFIPNTRVSFRAALVGGVIAGILWKTVGWGFTTFIATSSKYAAIYSSFAIGILLLIWLYISWLVLLVGSQIAFYVQYPKYMTLQRVQFVLSNRLRERLALQVMYLIGYNHCHNRPPWNLERLVERLELPDEPVHRILRILMEAGYLAEVVSDEPPVYLPVHDLASTRLVDLLTDVRAAGESRFLNLQQLPALPAVEQFTTEINGSWQAVLGERTLKNLVSAGDDVADATVPEG
jgi:membrane protein